MGEINTDSLLSNNKPEPSAAERARKLGEQVASVLRDGHIADKDQPGVTWVNPPDRII